VGALGLVGFSTGVVDGLVPAEVSGDRDGETRGRDDSWQGTAME